MQLELSHNTDDSWSRIQFILLISDASYLGEREEKKNYYAWHY